MPVGEAADMTAGTLALVEFYASFGTFGIKTRIESQMEVQRRAVNGVLNLRRRG